MSAVKKKTAAKRAPSKAAQAESSNPNITYTIRHIPRPTWERFAAALRKNGRQVNWALSHFVEKVADGQYTFEQ